jgi:hypothetical protein
MDKFQHKLRLLIVTGSAVGFIGGWGMLSHAGKPVADQTGTDQYVEDTTVNPVVIVPTALPPIDFKSLESVNGGSTNNVQVMPGAPNIQQSVPTFRPRLRTRSS